MNNQRARVNWILVAGRWSLVSGRLCHVFHVVLLGWFTSLPSFGRHFVWVGHGGLAA